MDLPEDLRHLFLAWMQAEHDVKVQLRSRVAHTYYNAMKSLKQYPNPITHPRELLDLKFFGEKLVNDMTSKLQSYCNEYGYTFPALPAEYADSIETESQSSRKSSCRKRSQAGVVSDDDNGEDSGASRRSNSRPEKRTKKKRYVPEINSGGYAILMALNIHDKHESGMTKSELVKHATQYCSTSFQANPATGNFYSAWASVNTLIKNEYVIAEGTPKYYFLTDLGREVADVFREMYEKGQGLSAGATATTGPSSAVSGEASRRRVSEPSRPLTSTGGGAVRNNNTSAGNNPLTDSSPNEMRNGGSRDLGIISSSPFRGGALDDIGAIKKRHATTTNPILSSPLANIKQASGASGRRSEYQIWKSGSYEIKFLLDNREVFSKQERDFFSTALKEMGINLEVRALPVGDGTWIAVNRHTKQETTLNFIFERKRLDDLAGSILDGRFREQKFRLERTGMKTIFYIVEEQMGSDISSFAEAIKTCICMNATYSGFHTMRTKDPNETMTLISGLTNLINKNYSGKTLLVLEPRSLGTQEEYKQLLHTMRTEFSDKEVVYSYNTFNEILGKTSLTTVREMFIRFLMAVRGVSLEKASAIQSHYKTPRALIAAYKRCHETTPMETKSNCKELIQQALKDEVGVRRVGSALSAKLAMVWCQQCCRES